MVIYWYFVVAAVLIIGVCEYVRYARKSEKCKPVEPLKTEIRIFHIFPDYKKKYPLECTEKDVLKFIIKGYTDETELREVEIDFDKVVWKHTKGNGDIVRYKDYINFMTPELKEKEKLIFISAHYLGLFDATWVKVIKK